MKAMLDTSAIIAAMLPDHVHHLEAHAWLNQAKQGKFEFFVSGHSVAEIYAVLTRLPRQPRIQPSEAWQLIQENVVQKATVITLTSVEYLRLIEKLSQRGISGGQVYDAIIAQAAESCHAEQLVTLNVSHFQKVWPEGIQRIVSPLTTAPPS